jgi:hypothetical protein
MSPLRTQVTWIPPKKHPKPLGGTHKKLMRKVYPLAAGYPRIVASELSPDYAPIGPHQKEFIPLGEIPEVEETFGYYEGYYGFHNGRVGIAESTCSARFFA